jgi:predicted DsbA family dithiol-disulfide isomerase
MSAEDGIVFNPWPHDALPAFSLPALEAAKCAAGQGPEVFDTLQERLFRAYFTEGLDIADPEVVATIATGAGVDRARLAAARASGEARASVLADWREAIEHGIQAIPTVVVLETGRSFVGLADLAQYRAAIEDAAR